MRFRFSALLISAAFALAAPYSFAQSDDATLPEWDRLTPQQREALVVPVRERWNSSPEKRARMLDHAQRWRQMTPEERKRAHRGVRRWQHMDPEQRTQMRAFYERTRDLTPEQRKAEREKLKAMTPAQRRAWMEQAAPPAGS